MPAQEQEIDARQKEVDAKLAKILDDEQRQQLKQLSERGPGGPGGGPGFGGRGGFGPPPGGGPPPGAGPDDGPPRRAIERNGWKSADRCSPGRRVGIINQWTLLS